MINRAHLDFAREAVLTRNTAATISGWDKAIRTAPVLINRPCKYRSRSLCLISQEIRLKPPKAGTPPSAMSICSNSKKPRAPLFSKTLPTRRSSRCCADFQRPSFWKRIEKMRISRYWPVTTTILSVDGMPVKRWRAKKSCDG